MDSDVEQGNLEKGCVSNTNGIVTIVFVYLLFIFEYFMTVYFGIWHQSFGLDSTNYDLKTVGSIFNTIFFSFFWLMMMWSHVVTVRTKAGYLPKEKEQLQENLFPE